MSPKGRARLNLSTRMKRAPKRWTATSLLAQCHSALPDAKRICSFPGKYTGKVRDTYDAGDGRLVLIITTDRQSGFDRYLGAIPFKGQVLNRASLLLV